MNRIPRAVAPAASAFLLGACATLFSSGPGTAELAFREGVDALERGDFRTAEARLGEVASRCESGAWGRRALLLLTTTAMDVRNPFQDADRAVRLAEGYLRLPDATSDGVSMARTLYLLALDRGADLGVPDTAPSGAAEARDPALPGRYARCDGGGVAERVRSLPSHPGSSTADRLEGAAETADSLRLVVDSLTRGLNAAQARIGELEAELERIRELLQDGGGDGVPDVP